MHHFDLRTVGELHDLADELEGRSDHGLAGYYGSKNGNDQAWVQSSWGRGIEERVRVGIWVAADVGCLSDVCQQQTGVGVAHPAQLDGTKTEGSQVGEESLDASEGQKNAAKHPPSASFVLNEKLEGKVRAESLQDRPVKRDQVVDAERKIQPQPDNDNGGKGGSKLGCAEWLNQEQEDQDAAGCASDGGLGNVGLDDGQSLDSTEDRLRRGQDTVRHNHGYSQDANDFEQNMGEFASFEFGAQGTGWRLQVTGEMSFHSNGDLFSRVTLGDIGL